MQFSSHTKIPYQVTLATATTFSLAGFFNVILFYFTRRELVTGGSGSQEALPALPNTTANVANHVAPARRDDRASTNNPPIRLRHIPSSTKDDVEDDSADYGLLPP